MARSSCSRKSDISDVKGIKGKKDESSCAVSATDKESTLKVVEDHTNNQSAKSLQTNGNENAVPCGVKDKVAVCNIKLGKPTETIKNCHLAENMAKAAALSCQKTLDEATSAIELSLERVDYATRKAMKLKDSQEANRYYSLAQVWREIMKDVTNASVQVQKAATAAKSAACNVRYRAAKLSKILETIPEDAPDRQGLAVVASKSALLKEVEAYKKKYNLLEAMKKCWESTDKAEIAIPDSTIYKFNYSFGARFLDISACLLLITGYILLAYAYHKEIDPTAYDAIISVGICIIILTLTFGLYRVYKIYKILCFSKKRRNNIAKIDEELKALRGCFPEQETDKQ